MEIHLYRARELRYSATLNGALQIGRQRPGEPAPFSLTADSNRLIIASVDDKLISRDHLKLHWDNDAEQLTVENLSGKRSVNVERHGRLAPGEAVVLSAPALISFEDVAVRVEQRMPKQGSSAIAIQTLEHRTLAPGVQDVDFGIAAQRSLMQATEQQSFDSAQLMRWLGEMMGVLQSAAATSNFLSEAVRAVDRILGMDTIVALTRENETWKVEFQQHRQSDSDSRTPAASTTILETLCHEKRTVYQVPTEAQASASLVGIKALVASPILAPDGEVIGALYAARYGGAQVQVPRLSPLEATMVEVIACSAAAGIAREKQQEKAIQARVQFEQFFTPQLARELEVNPRLLEGQDADISVLFCDIVGFSTISARLGSRMTMEWICGVMDVLVEAVSSRNGVLVDYIGDELMAMWGAPKPDEHHASGACLAARHMLELRQTIDEHWKSRIGTSTMLRVGICAGRASVGNTGSTKRLKYGPLGGTVNLASRLQSAGKQLGVSALVSQSVVDRVANDPNIRFRPLGKASFVNMNEPVNIFELGPTGCDRFQSLSGEFANVMHYLEHGEAHRAEELLSQLRDRFPEDEPSRLLHEKVQSGDFQVDCLWPLTSK